MKQEEGFKEIQVRKFLVNDEYCEGRSALWWIRKG